jgi:undecaprenyl diphosphate synthase
MTGLAHTSNKTSIPRHVAIVMDGNRRWARAHGLEMILGHRKVANEVIELLANACVERGIPYLTLWAFSTENWHRDKKEVDAMMSLFREMLTENIDKLHKKGIRITTIGDISAFDQDIQEKILRGVEQTKNNKKLTLTFALNYGGRDELLRTFKTLAKKIKNDELQLTEVTEELISKTLDTAHLPDPDLIVRPGGELRLSGYLPWQGVYAELYFTDVLMPDFSPVELDKALEEYARRQRRFGH